MTKQIGSSGLYCGLACFPLRYCGLLRLPCKYMQLIHFLLIWYTKVLRKIAKAISQCQCVHVAVEMSAFGGSSPKPLILKGCGSFMNTFEQVYKLRKKQSMASASGRLTEHTAGGFTGKKDMLTESSSYTRAFGLAMAWSFLGLPPEQICTNYARLGE